MPAISLRLFNVYGPRAKASDEYSGVIGIFLKQNSNNKSLTVVGNGMQTRSFVYVKDVVDAMILAANSKIYKKIFNVGAKKSIKINELVKIFKAKKKHISKRIGEPKNSSADIRKIKKELNWTPKIDIKEGINKLIKVV